MVDLWEMWFESWETSSATHSTFKSRPEATKSFEHTDPPPPPPHISQLYLAAVTTGQSSLHYSLLYLQWSPGINSPFVIKHLRPDMWCIQAAEWERCVRVCIHACVSISDSRLSLKLKQKSVHPPSQLYLFTPSAPQHPHACKHTNPHTQTHTY